MTEKNRLMRKWFCVYTRQSTTISAIAMVFCILAVAIKFPRNNSLDYLGLIIGILALLVTLLVAWNIWQTIDAKDTIKQMKDQVDTERTERETSLKKYSEQLSLFTFAANCVNDAIMMQTELHHIVHNNLSSARGRTGYNEAYCYLLRALRDAIKADVPESERLIDICLDNMLSCLNSAEELKEQYKKYALFNINLGAECDAVYKYIKDKYPNSLNRRQALILDELQNRRKNLTIV